MVGFISPVTFSALFFSIVMFTLANSVSRTVQDTLGPVDVCQNCSYKCNKLTGFCSGSCRHSFYGDKCEKVCANCYDCNKRSGDCTSCRNRNFGNRCEFKCNENCMIGCHIDGRCYNCNAGFWGRFCNNTCPSSHCKNGCDRWTGNCNSAGCYGGYWGNDCKKICPKHCGYGSCKQTDGTCQTCEPGYSGSRCTKRCNYEHCSLCQFDVTTCFNCFHGWYGEHCDKKCPTNCKEPYCNQKTGKCQKCLDGFFGPYCDGGCMNVCKTCSDNVTCDTCNQGFYGEECLTSCPPECKDCERNGKCKSCQDGHFGDGCRCRESECANTTSSVCLGCKNDSTWYPSGNGCCPCSEHCNANDDGQLCNSSGCINGCDSEHYGVHCIDSCSENCAEGNFTTCNNITGLCEHGCKPGWYMPKCDINCTLYFPHCIECVQYQKDIYSKEQLVSCHICGEGYYKDFLTSICKQCENCIDDICDGYRGSCKKGCKPGWYARRKRYLCENRCPENCADDLCNEVGGTCTNGCKHGYYGKYCKKMCPAECRGNLCNNITGDCLLGCNAGHYGFQCNETCNKNCQGSCDKDLGFCNGSVDVCQNCSYRCNKLTGMCLGACRHSFYGDKCEKVCANCYDCNKTSGDCTSCRNRHYGKKCEFKCNENCMIGCHIDGRCYNCNAGFWGRFCNNTCPSSHCKNGCDRWTGNCTSWGCYGGYWGNDCKKTCPKHCGYGWCKQPQGTCQTCEPGYSGSRCTKRCNYEHCSLCQFDVTTCFNCFHGWYGEHCDKKCPTNCKEPYCDQTTGKCQKCLDGFYGPYCDGGCMNVCKTCSDNVTCDTCNQGFYGEECLTPCPPECKDCERNGKCKSCQDGHFGDGCRCRESECANTTSNVCLSCKNDSTWYPSDIGCCPCSEHCNANYDEPLCNSSGCINGCDTEHYGIHCFDSCSENCAERNFTTCNNITGLCEHGCKPGWYMPKCDINCTLYFPHCIECVQYQKDIYSKEQLVSCHMCGQGYYKDFLTSICKQCENCIDDECDGYIGYCKHGCKPGWYARRKRYLCENRCPENCANGLCSEVGGTCINGCKHGYYGEYCKNTCPAECTDNFCSNTTGDCLLGCNARQYGFQCNKTCNKNCQGSCDKDFGFCTECVEGFYGLDCNQSCNTTCKLRTCQLSNGYCIGGCSSGWSGVFCEVELPQSQTAPKKPINILLYVAIGLSVLLLIAILWLIKLKLSYRGRDNSMTQDDTESSNDENSGKEVTRL